MINHLMNLVLEWTWLLAALQVLAVLVLLPCRSHDSEGVASICYSGCGPGAHMLQFSQVAFALLAFNCNATLPQRCVVTNMLLACAHSSHIVVAALTSHMLGCFSDVVGHAKLPCHNVKCIVAANMHPHVARVPTCPMLSCFNVVGHATLPCHNVMLQPICTHMLHG